MKWKCHVPGKTKTDWEGGYFPLSIEFSGDYPSKPPKVRYDSMPTALCELICVQIYTLCPLCDRLVIWCSVQIRSQLLSPQHLSFRNRLLEHLE